MSTNHTIDCPSCSSIKPAPVADATDARLTQWPIQIKLIGTVAPFLQNADLLVAADCTAFATPGFHEKFLPGKKVLIGCPKLDNSMQYAEKFAEIFSNNSIAKLTCLRMEVPCCGGMTAILKEAIKRSGKNIPMTETIVGVKGDLLSEKTITAEG
jgi:hypothetical protein